MNKLSKFRTLCFAWLAVLFAVVATGCKDDNTDSNLQIYYSEVVNIGPSMSFASSTPTYYGPAPRNFSISGITLDDQATSSDSFSINPESGIVSISNTDDIATGLYKLSISCQAADGGSYTFRDVFVVRMAAAAPEQIELSAPELVIPFNELTVKASVTVTPKGESVSITEWGLVQPEGAEYFAISRSGVITISSTFKGEVLPGVYPLPIRIKTHAGEMVYENLLTGKITSEPLSVTYPADGRLEVNQAFTGLAPAFKGSPEQLVYAIRQITPACDKFAIDPATGVVSAAADNGLAVDDEFTFDLTVTNAYGTADFDAVYKVTVIAFIAPIDPATFGYDGVEIIQAQEFTASKKAGFVGDEPQFSLGTLPEALAGKVTIDPVSGDVSAKNGHAIPVGVFEIPVKASNSKGEAETTLTLTVKENPYYFSKIVYGNNLDLVPVENYANQFYAADASDLTTLTPTTDAKEGTVLEWSIVRKHQMSGTSIHSATGIITVAGFKANNSGLVLVTATAGKGKPGETTVTVPVFFSFISGVNGVSVLYKPFVFQVNPRKGGTSVAPTINGVTDLSKFTMEYRRTFNYYNINGPDQHTDGVPAAGNFMGRLWNAYYVSVNKPNNYGQKWPLSYFENEKMATLSSALAYINQTTKSVVVNPNKWIDDFGPANGAMLGEIPCAIDGSVPDKEYKMFSIWIWFDEKF